MLASSAQLPALESPGCGNHVIGGVLDLGSEFERRLAVGGQLACQLRAAVKDKLGKLLHSVSQHGPNLTVHAVCLKPTKLSHTTVSADQCHEHSHTHCELQCACRVHLLSWSCVQQAHGQDSFCNAQAKSADCHSSQVLACSAIRCKRPSGFARHPHMTVSMCCNEHQLLHSSLQ